MGANAARLRRLARQAGRSIGHLKLQRLFAKRYPFGRDIVEDYVFFDEDAVGYDIVLLKVEKIILHQVSRGFGLFAIDLPLFFSEVLKVLSPSAEFAKAANRISLTVSSHLSHIMVS